MQNRVACVFCTTGSALPRFSFYGRPAAAEQTEQVGRESNAEPQVTYPYLSQHIFRSFSFLLDNRRSGRRLDVESKTFARSSNRQDHGTQKFLPSPTPVSRFSFLVSCVATKVFASSPVRPARVFRSRTLFLVRARTGSNSVQSHPASLSSTWPARA